MSLSLSLAHIDRGFVHTNLYTSHYRLNIGTAKHEFLFKYLHNSETFSVLLRTHTHTLTLVFVCVCLLCGCARLLQIIER